MGRVHNPTSFCVNRTLVMAGFYDACDRLVSVGMPSLPMLEPGQRADIRVLGRTMLERASKFEVYASGQAVHE